MEHELKWNQLKKQELKKVEEYAKGYMNFLDSSKTERECAKEIIRLAELNGFKDIEYYQKKGKITADRKSVV